MITCPTAKSFGVESAGMMQPVIFDSRVHVSCSITGVRANSIITSIANLFDGAEKRYTVVVSSLNRPANQNLSPIAKSFTKKRGLPKPPLSSQLVFVTGLIGVLWNDKSIVPLLHSLKVDRRNTAQTDGLTDPLRILERWYTHRIEAKPNSAY